MTAPLISFCDECGAANTPHASSCYACHMPLARSSSSPSSSSRQISLATFAVPTASSFSVEPGPGSLLNQRYRLMREIGQGGFGVVYFARDEK